MPVLFLLKAGQPVVVDFDPSSETQAEVEESHGVFSQYFETRAAAERAINGAKPDWYSKSNRLPIPK